MNLADSIREKLLQNEMDLEDPPLPPAKTSTGEPSPLEARCFMPPMPANEAQRQNVVNRLDLFGNKAAAASATTLHGPGSVMRRDNDNSSLSPSVAASHVSNMEEAVSSMKDHPIFRDIVSKCRDVFDCKVGSELYYRDDIIPVSSS